MLSSGKDAPPQADVECEVAKIAAALSDATFEITGTAAWVSKFDVAHYLHRDLLPMVIQTNNSEVSM